MADATVDTIKCTHCKKTVEVKQKRDGKLPIVRLCADCKASANKRSKMVANLSPATKEKWKAEGKTSQDAFWQEVAHEPSSTQASQLLKRKFEEREENEQYYNEVAEGDYVDSPDLKKRYADKPEQYEAIKRNVKPKWHPDREVNVYQDKIFKAAEGSSDRLLRSKSSSKETEATVKAKAAPKAKPKPKPEGTVKDPPGKALTDPQRKQCTNLAKKLSDALEYVAENFSEATLKANGVDNMIPQKVLEATPAAVLDAETSAAALQMAMTNEWVGSWKDVSSKAKTALSTLTDQKDRLDQYVELAGNS